MPIFGMYESCFARIFELENHVAEKTGSNAFSETLGKLKGRKPSCTMLRLLAYFVAAAAAFMLIRGAANDLRERYVEAEREYEENNSWTVTALEGGARLVRGMKNGVAYEYVEDGRILNGVSVAGIDLGGMDYAEGLATILHIQHIRKTIVDTQNRRFHPRTGRRKETICQRGDSVRQSLRLGHTARGSHGSEG